MITIGGWGEGRNKERGLRGTNYYIRKINKLIVQHRKYSQHFLVTLNGVWTVNILNQYVVHLKPTWYEVNYTSIKKGFAHMFTVTQSKSPLVYILLPHNSHQLLIPLYIMYHPPLADAFLTHCLHLRKLLIAQIWESNTSCSVLFKQVQREAPKLAKKLISQQRW